VHGNERGAAAQVAKRDVEVAEGERVAGVADDDRIDAGASDVGLLGREHALALPLAEGIGLGEDEQRPAGMVRGRPGSRGGRGRDDQLRLRRQARGVCEGARQRGAMARRKVRDDAVRDPPGFQGLDRPHRSRDRDAAVEQDAVGIEDEGSDAVERRSEIVGGHGRGW